MTSLSPTDKDNLLLDAVLIADLHFRENNLAHWVINRDLCRACACHRTSEIQSFQNVAEPTCLAFSLNFNVKGAIGIREDKNAQ